MSISERQVRVVNTTELMPETNANMKVLAPGVHTDTNRLIITKQENKETS